MLPRLMPSTNARWKSRKSATTGSTTSVEAAISRLNWSLALRLEEGQPDRERVLGFVLEEDQRAEEVVPGMKPGEDADDADGRQRLGQDDLEEDAELAGAVDPRRVRDLVRDLHQELAHQEDPEGVAEEHRHDQRQVGVDPVPPTPADPSTRTGRGSLAKMSKRATMSTGKGMKTVASTR